MLPTASIDRRRRWHAPRSTPLMRPLVPALVLLSSVACAPSKPLDICTPMGADQGAAPFRALVDKIVAIEADSAHLNRTLPFPLYVIVNVDHLDKKNPGALANACAIPSPKGDDFLPIACELHLEPEAVPLLSSPRDLNAVLAHEIFHCYQDALGTKKEIDQAGQLEWVREGTAAWAGEVVAEEEFGDASTLIDSRWRTYVCLLYTS